MTNQIFREFQAVRNVTDTNFTRGQLRIPFEIKEGSFVPDECYLRLKCTFSLVNGTQITQEIGIGPNIFFPSCLFQKEELYCDNDCKSYTHNFNHQINALRTRLFKSDEYLRQMGNSIAYNQPDVQDRVDLVASKNTTGNIYNNLEPNLATSGYRPPYFDYTVATPNQIAFANQASPTQNITFTAGDGKPIPDLRDLISVGDRIYFNRGGELIGTVDAVFKDGVSSSTNPGADVGAANLVQQFRISRKIKKGLHQRNYKQVTSLYKPTPGFFSVKSKVGVGKYELIMTPFPDNDYRRMAVESFQSRIAGTDFTFSVDELVLYVSCYPEQGLKSVEFYEIECQSQTVSTNNYNQKEFNLVNPSEYLVVAYQDSQVGQLTNYSTGKFKIKGNEEQNIDLFYLDYNNVQLPNPQWNGSKTSTIDTLTDRYYENYKYAYGLLQDKKSVESIQDWYDRGLYFLFKYNNPKERRVIVNHKFSTSFTDNSVSVLLFNIYKKKIEI